MIIGYRRVSGKLPLTADENGTRGTWLEKRRALIANLQKRGHTFEWLSQPTPNSEAAGFQKVAKGNLDLLMLEFGGTNLMFNKKAWEETFALIRSHEGKIIFLCDDPDLSFLWSEMPNEDWSRWTCAVNATELDTTRLKLKIPTEAKIVDTPFHALLDQQEFHDGENASAIYFGRPNGRMKTLTPYLQSGALTVAGRQEEWKDETIRVVEAPLQKDRGSWYRNWRACFAMYDQKHAACGWRTGRAYHALLAGIPVIAPRGNPALAWTYKLNSSTDLGAFLRLDSAARAAEHARQVEDSKADIEKAYIELGL